MNDIGKKNILFGLVYFLATLGLGIFLGNKLGAGQEWMQSKAHHLLKAAHTHGNAEALINILLGLVIAFYGSETIKLTKAVSILLIVGAVFHSGTLYLGGMGLSIAMKFTPIGGISLVLAMLLSIPMVLAGYKASK